MSTVNERWWRVEEDLVENKSTGAIHRPSCCHARAIPEWDRWEIEQGSTVGVRADRPHAELVLKLCGACRPRLVEVEGSL